jgi:ParB family transcriptional regulator, chromosome partitioning protein
MTDTITDLPLDAIEMSNRLRPISEADMLAVAASFAERGQDNPVLCRPSPRDTNKSRLVAGAHRVAAARYLGWTSIKAIIREMSEDEARLAEIDENVIRRELSVLDRAIFLKERKEVYLRAHPEAARGKAKKPKGGKSANLADFTSFGADAAKKTGLSARTIERAIQLLSELDPAAVEALRLSPLADNQAQLFALAALPAEEQRQAAGVIGAGEVRNVRAARVAVGTLTEASPDPQDVIIARFTALAAKASPDTLRFMASHVADRLKQKRAKAGEGA